MSGSTIGGAVGAVVGFYFGGPQGAQIGWMVGSAVGGYVDPEQIQGPRLQDARTQTSRDGIAIPFGWGTFPLAGNVIAQQPKVQEHKKKERQGKGGPEVTTYSYTRTYAIGLCEGPITGILQVKRNGKVVYDARTDDAIAEEVNYDGSWAGEAINRYVSQVRAANAKWSNKATIYLGDETQMPDPALEAIFGAGTVPAHRGLAYFVVEDDDVTDLAGAIPQYEVVVAGVGTVNEGPSTAERVLELDMEIGEGGVTTVYDKTHYAEVGSTYGTSALTADKGHSSGTSLHLLSGGVAFTGPQYFVDDGTSLKRFHMRLWVYLPSVSPRTNHRHPLFFIKKNVPSEEAIGLAVKQGGGLTWYNPFFSFGWDSDDQHVPFDQWAKIDTYATPGTSGSWNIDIYVNDREVSPPINGTAILHGVDPDFDVYVGDLSVPDGVISDVYVDDVEFNIGLASDTVSIPDAPGYYITPDGVVIGPGSSSIATDKVPLSTIVANVCERRGIDATEYDVAQLTDLVTGFVVGRETDAASIIQSLAPAYFFDPAEWDARLRFIKRGGTAVGAINGDDLVERDGDAFERERVQEAELLRRVTVGYNDPQAAYSLTTQKWERRAGTVQALGEASVELPLTLDADAAATIAKRRGLVAWGEPEKQKFSLPYRLSKYTPTDVLNFTDDDGQVYPIRLMDLQDDSGVRYVESSMNSAEAYGATATGVVPRPPSITEPALRGPTNLAVMDLPLWRSSDTDTLGLYVAACGYLGGWQGAQVDVSTDNGVSYSEAAQVTVPATIGTTTTALAAWASSEYPGAQTVTVTLPDAPESVSYEALLRYNNRAAIQLDSGEWGILQYQTVVANGGNSYTLSGILHGRYATTPGAAAAGARFVLLDAAVQFVPVERHLLGTTFKVRATTYGTSSDAAPLAGFAFTDGSSQTEWPVHGVTATRDGSDSVTVTWIGRARLGVETAPYHSTNFAGYRVTYSDGQSFDVGPSVTTHTRSSTPASQTITVRPLNAITGAGPASTGITV